jgi:hypothetical protein
VILRSPAFSVLLIQYDNAVGLLKRYLKIARIAGLTPVLLRGAGGSVSVFQGSTLLSARWLMPAFMLAATVDSKASGSMKITPA